MTDTASLVIKVDSSSAAKATVNLDKLDKAAGNTERAANKVGKAWGLALGAVAVAGIGLATAALTKYIRNTIESERVQAQLASRIKDTGAAAGRTLAQLNEQAAKLQNLTVFDDESIGGVQAMLLTFKEIQGVNFDDATAAVLDLSTAMGADLNSAALQLGKALNDPVKGMGDLSRAGVQFSVDQKAMIKSLVEAGDKAAAQRVILRQLEGQMGTAAEAARDTLGGALKALQNSFDNLLEGDSGDAGVKGTRKAIEGLIRTLNDPDTKQGFAAMVSGIVSVANAAAVAVSELAGLWERAQRFTTLAMGGAGGKSDLKQIRYEIQTHEAQLADWQNGGVKEFLAGPDIAAAKKRLVELRDLEQQSIDLFGDPSKPHAMFSSDGAIPESMLRPKGSGGATGATEDPTATTTIRDRTKATQELTAAEKAWAEWQEEMNDIQEVWNEGERDALQLAQDKQDAIEENRKAVDGMIDDMEFELSIVGKTNKEREREIALRYAGADATEAQRQKIVGLTEATYEAREATGKQIELMDTVRDAGSDFFVDWVGGTKSFKDAALDAFESIRQKILQMIAENLMDQLFGKRGDPAGGSTGGFDWGGLIGSFFGGGGSGGTTGSVADLFDGQNLFSGGGYTGPGGKHQFAGAVHKGEVVFSQDDVSRAGGVGAVEAMRKGGGGSNVTNITVNVPRDYSFRTGDQVAQSVAAKQQSVMRRSS